MAVSQYSSNYPTNTLYTKGGEFTLQDTGMEYRGPYHVVDGKPFTGKPKNENPLPLLAIVYDRYSTYVYDKLLKFKTVTRTYRAPKFFRPVPTRSDYVTGYFIRYVVIHNLNPEKMPTEIAVSQANTFGRAGGVDGGLYTLFKIKWTITGALEDFQTKGGKILSVENANKEVLRPIIAKYPIMQYAFKNYTEFAEFTFL